MVVGGSCWWSLVVGGCICLISLLACLLAWLFVWLVAGLFARF